MNIDISFFQIFTYVFLGICFIAYTLTAGADFGLGILYWFCPKAHQDKYRKILMNTLAPVWEINHVWIVAIVVVLFVSFPKAFSIMATGLSMPLIFFLLAVILRGFGFALNYYNPSPHKGVADLWGHIMAFSSVIAPFFLGISVGTLFSGRLPVRADLTNYAPSEFVNSWFHIYPLMFGVLFVFICLFLGAITLYFENKDSIEHQNHCGFFAVISGELMNLFILLIALTAAWWAKGLWAQFASKGWFGLAWVITLLVLASIALTAALMNKFKVTLYAGLLQVLILLVGPLFALFPFLAYPSLTIFNSSAGIETIQYTSIVFAVGAAILLPAIAYVYYLFKTRARLNT